MERRHVRARDVWVVLGNALLLIVAVVLAWRLRTLITWILVAILLALAAYPPMAWLTRRGLRRGWAVLIVFTVALGLVVGLVASVVPVVMAQGRQLAEQGPELLERIKQAAPVRWLEDEVGGIARLQTALRDQVSEPQIAFQAASSVLRALAGVVTIAVLAVFFLLFGHDVFERSLAWIEPGQRERWRATAERIREVVGRYVLGVLIVAGISGLVMGVTTFALGVPYFLALALVTAVLGIVPYLGTLIAAVLIVGVTFASVGTQAGLIALGVYIVYQQVENNVLQPLVQRRTIHMNPLLIALALFAGTALAGIVGALLALPLAGALQILLADLLARRQARWAVRGAAPESG
jgi:putative heme transporter